jgi:DNA-directed RNA polymerase specialized sigma24 family protein
LTQPLTATGLALVLARLEADPGRSAAAYESLRLALVRFFGWRGASFPDERADETLDRLASRLDRGEAVEDVRSFALGIARHVLQEAWRSPAATRAVHLDDAALDALGAPEPEEDGPWLPCLQGCLARLPRESRGLVLAYYQGGGRERIERRARLAAGLGLNDGALRSRVQRLRDGLERCVTGCVAGETSPEPPPPRIGGVGQD